MSTPVKDNDLIPGQSNPAAQSGAQRPSTPTNTVPPPEHERRTKETPAIARSVHSSNYWDGTLAEKRITLLEELGYAVPEVPVISFIETFLPSLKADIDINAVAASLRENEIIQENGRWSSFPQDPKLCRGENVVFHPLEDIFNKVVETAAQQTSGWTQTFVLRLLPDAIPESERASRTRPDGCVVLKEVEDRSQGGAVVYRWYDIALTCEFKLQDKDDRRDENVTQIIYSMQHTMTLDPCKRFTFGVTIENTNMRLWFCSRAAMVVSEPFNFITEPELLIRVFLSLAFASRSELGWDPTIRVVDPNAQKRVYQIEVNGNWYEVLQVLSDFGADAIIGRATRVFRVKLVNSDKVYVLKDVWVEDDRILEHIIYKMILEDVEKAFDEATKRLVASHLLTPVDNWVVTVGGQEDHTKDVMMRGREPSFEKSFKLVASMPTIKEFSKSVSHMKSTDKEVLEELKAHLGSRIRPSEPRAALRHRRHYRVIFNETAVPIWAVTVLSDSFVVLRDCATALRYVHKSGWIHRDISAGNVYFYDGRGLIGDLEYAKRTTVDGSHQMRTGTPDFMAVEVMRNEYIYLPLDRSSRTKGLASDADLRKRYNNEKEDNIKQVSFLQNEAHDIESLWWIAIYILFFNGDVSLLSEETKVRRHARKVWTQRIFPSTATNNREFFFRKPANFMEGVSWLPSSFELPIMRLYYLRGTIADSYHDFEETFPDFRKEAFDGLQDIAASMFGLCVEATNRVNISSYKAMGRTRQQALSQAIPHPTPPDTAEPPAVPIPAQHRTLQDTPSRPGKKLRIARIAGHL